MLLMLLVLVLTVLKQDMLCGLHFLTARWWSHGLAVC